MLSRARGKNDSDGDRRGCMHSAERLREDPLWELGGLRRQHAPAPASVAVVSQGPGPACPEQHRGLSGPWKGVALMELLPSCLTSPLASGCHLRSPRLRV